MCKVVGVLLITSTGPGSGYIYVNASSRNGTLGTHPQFAPPKRESLENVLQKVLNITFPFPKHFSYFFKKGVQFLIHFYAFWAIPHILCAKSSIAFTYIII